MRKGAGNPYDALDAQIVAMRRGPARTSSVRSDTAADEDLPPGWVRMESRSKPGCFYYAHPATKRTQVERPGPPPTRSAPRQQAAVPAAAVPAATVQVAAAPRVA